MSFVRNLFNWVGEWLVLTLKILIIFYILIFLNFDVPSSRLGWVWLGLVTGFIWGVIGKIFESITNSIASASLDTELAKAIQERQSKKKSWKDESERRKEHLETISILPGETVTAFEARLASMPQPRTFHEYNTDPDDEGA